MISYSLIAKQSMETICGIIENTCLELFNKMPYKAIINDKRIEYHPGFYDKDLKKYMKLLSIDPVEDLQIKVIESDDSITIKIENTEKLVEKLGVSNFRCRVIRDSYDKLRKELIKNINK